MKRFSVILLVVALALGVAATAAGCGVQAGKYNAPVGARPQQDAVLTCRLDGDEYSLNLQNGEFAQNGQKLAVCPLPEYQEPGKGLAFRSLQVSRSQAGNFLLQAEGLSHGALTSDVRWQGWVSQNGDQAYGDYFTMLFAQYGPGIMQADGCVWFNGQQGLWRIEEASAQAETMVVNDWLYQPGQEYQLGGYCYWTDGQYFLLGDTDFFQLYDLANARSLDLRPLLLSDDVVNQVNAVLRENDPQAYPQPDSYYYFWDKLGQMHQYGLAEAMPWLIFVGEADGQLNFELKYRYYKASEHDLLETVLPLSFSLSQLEDLL